jgi:hypothetical protein
VLSRSHTRACSKVARATASRQHPQPTYFPAERPVIRPEGRCREAGVVARLQRVPWLMQRHRGGRKRDLQNSANRWLARAAHPRRAPLTEPQPRESGAFSPIQGNFASSSQVRRNRRAQVRRNRRPRYVGAGRVESNQGAEAVLRERSDL